MNDGSGEPQRDAQVVRILELLESLQVKKRVQQLLEDAEQPKSGTWDVVRERVHKAIIDGGLTYQMLVDLLDEVEAYGRQHIILFKLPQVQRQALADPEELRARLIEWCGDEALLDEPQAVVEPDQATLCSIRMEEGTLSIKWAETRVYWDLIHQEESAEDDGREILTKKYERKTQRAAVVFSADIDAGQAELRIATLERGSDYQREVASYADRLREVVDLDALPRVDLTGVVKQLFDCNEVRPRRGKLRLDDGTTVDIASPDEAETFRNNDFYKGGRSVVGDEFGGRFVQVYWLPGQSGGLLTSEVSSYVYPRHEVAFAASASKSEVLYVVGRLRQLASA